MDTPTGCEWTLLDPIQPHANVTRLRHYGFKIVFIWGLCLYGVGALVAWPCLVYRSFGGFCAAIFIIGNGLGSLETAANPYITICGPPRYSEIRINFSQAFNGIGTVIAPVLGSYVFFKDTGDDASSLKTVRIPKGRRHRLPCLIYQLTFRPSPLGPAEPTAGPRRRRARPAGRGSCP